MQSQPMLQDKVSSVDCDSGRERILFKTISCLLGEPLKQIFGKSWEFDPIPTFFQNSPKLNWLGFYRNMPGVPQSQPKNHKKCHQKSHKNHQSSKKWDFFMKE